MTAVVTLKHGQQGRHYRLPTDADYAAVRLAQERVAHILEEWERGSKQGLCPVPDEPINPIRPSPNARGLSAVTRYGMSSFGDVFTARQKVALVELGRFVADTISITQELLAIALDRTADGSASISRWLASGEEVKNVFSRQALAIVWDFGESNYLANSSRSWDSAIESIIKVVESGLFEFARGTTQFADATSHPLPDQAAAVWFTDPPYYDAIPYADLSDFFLIWLKRTLLHAPLLKDPIDPHNPLSPKQQECVWNQSHSYDGRPKDAAFFEATIARAFSEGRRVLSEEGIGGVVFAHKTTEGWEALLSGIVEGGWTVTASWPIATESGTRACSHKAEYIEDECK